MDIAEVENRELGSVAIVVYVAMLGATVTGQLVGIVADGVLGARALWVPCSLSVLLEGVVGARYGAARSREPLTAARCLRVSGWYSGLLLVLSVPLGLWIVAARPASGAHPRWTLHDAALALGALAFATVARAGLMSLFSPRRR
jgi:hypothetical protein